MQRHLKTAWHAIDAQIVPAECHPAIQTHGPSPDVWLICPDCGEEFSLADRHQLAVIWEAPANFYGPPNFKVAVLHTQCTHGAELEAQFFNLPDEDSYNHPLRAVAVAMTLIEAGVRQLEMLKRQLTAGRSLPGGVGVLFGLHVVAASLEEKLQEANALASKADSLPSAA